MKAILGALAVVIGLGAVTVATPASAACWPTPYGMRCNGWGPGWHHHWHHWGHWHHGW